MRQLPEDRKRPCHKERDYFWNETCVPVLSARPFWKQRDITMMTSLPSLEMMAMEGMSDHVKSQGDRPNEPDGTDNHLCHR